MKRRFLLIGSIFGAALLVVLLASCGGGGGGAPALSSAKAITEFAIVSPAAPGTIDENAKTISVAVPYGTDVTALVATFTTTGARVKIGATVQESSKTANDFTNPVVYTVIAEDGTTVDYTVTVTVAPPVCGNNVREGDEQCDDGNTSNLDGCSATCKFEQNQRVNWLKFQFTADSYCTANALGKAFPGTVQSQIQQQLDSGIADGSVSLIFHMIGLEDLTGTSDAAVEVGVLNGTPEPAGALPYNGASDLDWWYHADSLELDADRMPTERLQGAIDMSVLSAGPGRCRLGLSLGGQAAPLTMSEARLSVSIGASSVPLNSTGEPPGHLAAEHLDPALVSYAATGQKTVDGSSKLCGNISASSLAQTPIMMYLVETCDQGYTISNSMLDVLIGGCTYSIVFPIISPTQPDRVDQGVPPAGAGGPYKLSAGAGWVVTTCRDNTNTVVPLTTCLEAAAYSIYLKFATDRVIVK